MFEFDLSVLFELLSVLYCTSAIHFDLLTSVDDSSQLQYQYCFFFSLFLLSADNFYLVLGEIKKRDRSQRDVLVTFQ